ncbi:MAG: hypothetical protein JSV88_28965 [Candidatus Aminicenantes bacterium]|nr:MAG: hypothetical protein JSV88_28965 [Candidatus Aminicenantes bacterium]
MSKTKCAHNRDKRAILVFCSVGLFFLFLGSLFYVSAATVEQKIGFKDMAFSSLNKVSCQVCHGEDVVDTHHKTQPALSGDCASCHTVSTEAGNVGVSLERNCMVCHKKSPHHATEAAANNECTTCHESPGVSEYSMEVPPYQPSNVTPTVASCKNCHGEGDVEGEKIVDMKTTHHGISLKGCNVCHDPDNKQSQDIRICERCHSARAIHEVLAHVEKENCVKCHEVNKG